MVVLSFLTNTIFFLTHSQRKKSFRGKKNVNYAARFGKLTLNYDIQCYDSLRHDNKQLMMKIKKYLRAEYKHQTKNTIVSDGIKILDPDARTPLQTNSYDCGVFTCVFAWCTMMRMRIDTFTQSDMSNFREHVCLSVCGGALRDVMQYPNVDPRRTSSDWITFA